MNRRLSREKQILKTMIAIYCYGCHKIGDSLCPGCHSLLEYALQHLQHCKFGEKKPACRQCPVHCYRRDMREKIIQVMRYSGPRLLFKHPLLALAHWLDSWRNNPG
ncbi:nitrous oxide-stimulated promoter family protein [Lucifera butyrica]|uniref:nitrous oxide-stimulated promoter family protein n=1 Tax=Lucifera butyrica TaxID=1351585 RepID=UPI000F0199DA|nr:nitrous oxide-stimulated promoter family protein [Lucifera butyrica]